MDDGLSFSKRTTALVTVFPCIFIAKQARCLTKNPQLDYELVSEYNQLLTVYALLRHQDVPMQAVVLRGLIIQARCTICALNATVREITSTKYNQPRLSQIQIVVANALTVMSQPALFDGTIYVGENMQVQTVRVPYTITEGDIIQGFSVVPVTWPTPFADTMYTAVFGVDEIAASPSAHFAAGEMQGITPTGMMTVILFPAVTPLIQGQLDAVDVSTAKSLSIVAPISTLYMVTVYIVSATAGEGANTENVNLTYTDASGAGSITIEIGAIVDSGDGFNHAGAGETITTPIFAAQGTTITVATVLKSGSTAFSYDVSMRVVQMPNNATLPAAGSQIVVEALAVHDASPCNC